MSTPPTGVSKSEVPKALEALIMRLWAKDRPNTPPNRLRYHQGETHCSRDGPRLDLSASTAPVLESQ